MGEEHNLIKGCISGDKAAWDEFVHRYARLVYNYIYNTLKIKGYGCNPDTIQDLFQGIFCSLMEDDFRRLRNFKGKNGCSLSSWLRTLTINYTIDYIRKTKPVISLDQEKDEGDSLLGVLADDCDLQDESLIKKERLEQLAHCIEKLSISDKYLLEFSINRRLPSDDLMRVLKLNRGALDMRKNRILNKLRDCFRREGFMLDF